MADLLLETSPNGTPVAPEHELSKHTYTPIKEAAKYYSVDASTIRRWLRANILSAVRIGGTIRVDLGSLKAQPIGGVA